MGNIIVACFFIDSHCRWCSTIGRCNANYGRPCHYIFVLWFLLLCFFFHRLFSAVVHWMSTILQHAVWPLEYRSEMCCTRLAGNTGRKNDAKNRHLRTIAQLYRAISSPLWHISTIGKKFLSSNISPHVLTVWWTSAHYRLRSVP